MRSAAALLVVTSLAAAACAEPPSTTLDTATLDTVTPDSVTSDSAAPDTVTPDDAAAPDDLSSPAIDWTTNPDGVQSGYLTVPLDYADPAGRTVQIFVARRPAADPAQRIGSLLVNPGGPGFGGADYAAFAPQIFDADLLDRFDIVGWDPRGTGMSEPAIDCIDDYDLYYASIDVAEDQAAESERLARMFAEECIARNGEVLPLMGTNNSARDMDSLRRALGEEQISYLGFSYGSELGAVWATLFPETVRAAVFDGAADPTADALEGSLQQQAGFEATLATFLADCSSRPTCAFNNDGDAEGAFDALMEQLEDEPIPSVPGRPLVGRGVATTAVIMAMYQESFWPGLEAALADAAAGDGAGLLDLYDTYYQYYGGGEWGDELEAFQAISCADTVERPTVEEMEAVTPQYHAVAPRLVPADAAPGFFCTFFPPAVDPRVEVTGAGAGPIVVVGATGDPTTPLESTRTMAETLEDGRLVVLESNNHGAYFTSACVREIVASYLVDLEVPADGTECPA